MCVFLGGGGVMSGWAGVNESTELGEGGWVGDSGL